MIRSILKTKRNNLRIVATLIAIFAAGVILSCSQNKFSDELNKIDNLIVINDSVGRMLESVDSVQVLNSRKIFEDNWKLIREVVESIDDVELLRENEYWTYITNYESHDRALKKLIRKYNRLVLVQRDNRQQLEDLHSSVKRNQIPADSIDLYITSENLAVANMEHEANLYIPDLKRTLHLLDSLHQHVPAAIQSYEAVRRKSN